MSRYGVSCLLVSILSLYVLLTQSAAAIGPFSESTGASKGSQDFLESVPDHAGSATAAAGVTIPGAGLCIHVTSTCHVVGGILNVAVNLGESDSLIVAAQFSLQYDPTELRFFSMAPGAVYDSQSPFTTAIGQAVSELEGTIGYAVGVDPSTGVGTQGPATIAYFSFVIKETGSGSLCLFDAGDPFFTLLSGQDGQRVPIDNSLDCPSSSAPPVLACAEMEVSQTCDCDTGTPDCSHLDTDCAVGICNDLIGQCEAMSANEGGPCDDRSVCTTTDTCTGGVCRGAGCPNPSVCIAIEDDCKTDDNPFVARVTLGAGQSNDLITAAQLNLEFDPDVIELVSADAGSTCDPESPFVESGYLEVDNVTGNVFFAVSVDPVDFAAGGGTPGPATLACLRFIVRGPLTSQVCLVAGVNPRFTLLTNQTGQRVEINNSQDCPTVPGISALACAESCKRIPAVSAWGMATLALLLACAAKIRFGRLRRIAD